MNLDDLSHSSKIFQNNSPRSHENFDQLCNVNFTASLLLLFFPLKEEILILNTKGLSIYFEISQNKLKASNTLILFIFYNIIIRF